MNNNELEDYDEMMKDRDKWKSLYFTMRELSGNATEIAERWENRLAFAKGIIEEYVSDTDKETEDFKCKMELLK
jgi:hypothetical protein